MTIYIVTDSLEIKEETFCVADLAQFQRDMNDTYGDSWFSDIEDARDYQFELGMDTFSVDCGGRVTLKEENKK